MTVSVLTLAAGRHDHLGRLLDGLAAQSVAPDDVIVVDLDGSGALDDVIAGRARRVRRPSLADGHLDLAGGRNAAARVATGEKLVFLDVDIIPAPDLVARYVDVLAAYPEALACGPVRYLRPDWIGTADPADHAQLDAVSDAPATRPSPTTGVLLGSDHELFWSLSFGVTRETWFRLGGFDEAYCGYGGEDTDLGLRARQHGIPLAWFTGGIAYHQWHPPSRYDDRHLHALVANAHRFHARWGCWPMEGWLRELHELGRLHFDAEAGVLEVAA